MNRCTFSGRLVADAEMRYTSSGTPVTSFRIAVDAGYGEHKRTDFINCVLWKREQLTPHLTKGKPVILAGEYQSREYEDRNGQRQRTVEIIVRDLEFQQGQPKQGQGGQQQSNAVSQDPNPCLSSEPPGMDEVPF